MFQILSQLKLWSWGGKAFTMEHFFVILYCSYCWLLLVGRYRSRKTLKTNMRVVVHASGFLLVVLCTFVLAIVFPGGEFPWSPARGWWNTCWKSRKTFPKPEGPHLRVYMKYFSFFGTKIFLTVCYSVSEISFSVHVEEWGNFLTSRWLLRNAALIE